ncbi:hypothetical protein [Mycobacterium branderi]|uniref:DUF3052 domain-containing protein n=1 Tax=Mycobacterium branderi TaxID=43348 RepID=A0A7I7W247_9MYCO|nr:hypothetical protein [Mycobacterium branderi]MCV7233697.1 hypothetical protein [Mycobacterium branderi]ORA37939.1 hypothetical protein BST20_12545 [Mycobacterium branderi]BBZ11047.1 hypothetical protein MBRA_12420 [Mycobacterium branderi]
MNDRERVELGRKLRIKPEHWVALVNPPPECASIIPLVRSTEPDRADVVIGFATQRADLDLLHLLYAAARDNRLAWLAYPRPGRLSTDLRRDLLIRDLRKYGVDPADFVSVDETWLALLLRPGPDTAPDAEAAELLAWPCASDA